MAAAGDFVKGRWLRQGRAPCGSADARDLGIGADYDKRQPGCGADFVVVQGEEAPPGAAAGLTGSPTRACAPLARLRSAPACGLEAHEREGRGGRRGARTLPASVQRTGSLLPSLRRRCRLGAVANARADVGPRSSRGRIREGQPSRSAVARAPPHGCPATACCRHPAGAGRQRAQGRRQPSGWCVDGIVVTCSDPAQRCRAAPAAALGEPVFAEW